MLSNPEPACTGAERCVRMRREEGPGAGRVTGAGGRGCGDHRTRREARRIRKGPTRKAGPQGLILTWGEGPSDQSRENPLQGARAALWSSPCPAGRWARGFPDRTQPRGPDSPLSAGEAPSHAPRVRRTPGPGLIGPAELPIQDQVGLPLRLGLDLRLPPRSGAPATLT